ncbi:hypothetical protein G6F68_011253 [Rhizopus microsporus]|nr:hypothetical protein G6F68_011253 [Rhizopus microsporus]
MVGGPAPEDEQRPRAGPRLADAAAAFASGRLPRVGTGGPVRTRGTAVRAHHPARAALRRSAPEGHGRACTGHVAGRPRNPGAAGPADIGRRPAAHPPAATGRGRTHRRALARRRLSRR